MKGRVSQYIITSLLAIALVIPGFFSGQADSPLILDGKTVTRMVLQGLPLLTLLLCLSLFDSPEKRRSRGWRRPVPADLPAVILLVALSLLFSRFLPAVTGSYSVRLPGIGGITMILLVSLTTALTEELFFRSWLLSSFSAMGWPRWLALLVSVTAFAALHLWQGWTGLLFAALTGFAYSIWFLRFRGLFTIVAAHTIHNALALWLAAGR